MEDKHLLRVVKKARRGDREAFSQLVELKAERILYIATYLMGNKADGEDAAQESIIALGRDIGKLKKAESFDSWLYRIVFNVSIAEKKRKQKADRSRADFELASATAHETHIDFMPEKKAELKLDKENLISAITMLPDHYRMCLLLYYYENMSYAEIAEAMNISEHVVANTLNRAKSKLRSHVQNNQAEAPNPKLVTKGAAVLPTATIAAVLAENSKSVLSPGAIAHIKATAATAELSSAPVFKTALTAGTAFAVATAAAAVVAGIVFGFGSPQNEASPVLPAQDYLEEKTIQATAQLSGQSEGIQAIVLVEGENKEAWESFLSQRTRVDLVQAYSENGFRFSVYQTPSEEELAFFVTVEKDTV